jgi:hypothetical protein
MIAFHLFLRIDEVFQLKHGDIELDLLNHRRREYHHLRIKFRKCSQDDAEGQPYFIYDEDDVPELALKSAIDNWLKFIYSTLGT